MDSGGPSERSVVRPVKAFTILCIEEPKAGAIVYPGAAVAVKGWAISNEDVESVRISLADGVSVHAEYGHIRQDVAKQFPTYQQADHSGFLASVTVPATQVQATNELSVVVRTASGRETRKTLLLRIAGHIAAGEAAAASLTKHVGSTLWPIRLSAEEVRIDEAGVLHVRGTAFTTSPLLELRLSAGGIVLGAPEFGLPSPDFAAVHGDYLNAARSGFRLTQQLDTAARACPTLRIEAFCESGERRQIIVPIDRSPRRGGTATARGEHFCCDVASVNSNGQLVLSGWAVAESGIAAITVELVGCALGEASIGLVRADVGNRYPRLASARHSGFHFVHDLGFVPDEEFVLTLRIRHGDGNEREVLLPIAPGRDEFANTASVLENIRYGLDQPSLSGDRARDPVHGTFTISGWASAHNGIDSVEIKIDDIFVGRAYYGIRREDVAAAHPELRDGLLSGFTYHTHARIIGAGDHTVSVVIRTKGGESADIEFSIRCERPPEIPAWETIRAKISQAEINHSTRILDRFGHVNITVYVRLPDFPEQCVGLAARTLASLHGQTYHNWHAVLLLPKHADWPWLPGRMAQYGRWPTDRVSFGLDSEYGATAPRGGATLVLVAGDRLAPDALMAFAVLLAQDPAADFVYGDDRRPSPITETAGVWFKPDWSPDLLLAFNYVGRAWCARDAVLTAANLSPANISDACDYELALRLTEQARDIVHLPRVLLDAADGEVTQTADQAALAGALVRRGVTGSVEPGRVNGTFRVRRDLVAEPRVSVIIPTIAARGLIETAIDGLRNKTLWRDLELICIDNIPIDQESRWKAWLREQADHLIEIAEPFNWSRFNNIGAAAATGDFLLFLNDDIEVIEPDWLGVLVGHAQRPEVGVVGPQLLYPDGKIQHSGIFMTDAGGRHAFRFAAGDEPGPFGLAQCERNVLAVTGACMLMRRDAFEAAGRFNEIHPVINNDVDYCLRARRAGQRVVFTPYARLIHHELVSRANLPDVFDERDFRREWGNVLLRGDPYFNPNLSPTSDMWKAETEPTEVVFAGHPLLARETVRRILAIKLDHIGDFLTALPALRRLKLRFPDAELHVLAAPASIGVARFEPCIDGALEFSFFHSRSGDGQRGVTPDELQALQARLLPLGFDMAIDLRLQPDTREVLRHTGAPFLVGFDHENCFPWLDVTLLWEGDEKLVPKRAHVADRMMQLVEALSVMCEAAEPALFARQGKAAAPPPSAMLSKWNLPEAFRHKPIVCIHVGVGSNTRQWPVRHFVSLIDLLTWNSGAAIILVGTADEEATAQAVVEAVCQPESVASLVGHTDLADLRLVMRASRLFVGNNSGPQHLAAALDVPTVGVHSAVVEAIEWGPLGSNAVAVRRKMQCGPCYIASAAECMRGMACLTGLLPGDVYRACVLALSAGAVMPADKARARRRKK